MIILAAMTKPFGELSLWRANRFYPESYVAKPVAEEVARLSGIYRGLAQHGLAPNHALQADVERDRGFNLKLEEIEARVLPLPVLPLESSAAGVLQAILAMRNTDPSP